ncbi:Cyclin-dependent kinases regulatory subunit (Cell division control protein cks1) [Rhodotorula toruloides]
MPSDDVTYQDLVDRISYSDRYSDDEYEYRHVQLPRQMLKLIPKDFFEPDSNVLRLLTEDEWRGIGILLFRREKDYQKKYGNGMR